MEAGERLGVVRALRALHQRQRACLTILAYHRVMPTDSLGAYPFDPELISTTPRQFEWQMAYLRRHMNPVSLAQIMAHLDGAASLPPSAIAVTFDDGFSDTYRYAFPILKRYSIPATVFVATGYVDSGKPFWFELATYLVLRVEPGALSIGDSGPAFPTGASVQERRRSLERLHELLKGLPNARRLAIVSEWGRRFAAEIERGAVDLCQPISWAQVREMAAAGIDFGSHSVTHPNLAQLEDPELAWELSESKRVLEEQLQHPVHSLAYPIGTALAFNERVLAAAERAGFRLGVSYISGANPLNNLQRLELRRHGVRPHIGPSYFRALTSLPAWLD